MNRKQFAAELLMSITSVRFYREIAKRPLKEGVKYFSLLILLMTLVLSARLTFDIFKGLSVFEAWSREHLPDIVVEKGEVFVDVPQPWVEEEGDFVVIIDTTGETKKIDEYYPQGVLLTQNQLLLKSSPYETRRVDLSQIDFFRFNPETVSRFRRNGQWFLPPLFALFLFVYFWIAKLLQVFFFSGVSLLTNWNAKRGLSYETLLTIGMYAITPPLLLFCAIRFLGLRIRFFDLIYLSTYAALLVTAVLQFPPKTELETNETPGGPEP